MGAVRAVKGAFGTDQLIALEAEIDDLLIFMNFAVIDLHSFPLGRAPRALGED